MKYVQQKPSAAEFTVFDNAAGLIGKEYQLTAQGTLDKKVHGEPSRGTYAKHSVTSIDAFMEELARFSTITSCCFVYGVPKAEMGYFVTKPERKNRPESIARCREDLAFPDAKPGVLYLDFDLADVANAPTDWRVLDDIVCAALPGLRETRRAWKPSNSAFLYR